jgi:hypothetical protein
MTLSKRSISKVLDLIENKIGQLDVFIPHDTDELDALLRCREELKVEATHMQETAAGNIANMVWSEGNATDHAQSDFSCDVI